MTSRVRKPREVDRLTIVERLPGSTAISMVAGHQSVTHLRATRGRHSVPITCFGRPLSSCSRVVGKRWLVGPMAAECASTGWDRQAYRSAEWRSVGYGSGTSRVRMDVRREFAAAPDCEALERDD